MKRSYLLALAVFSAVTIAGCSSKKGIDGTVDLNMMVVIKLEHE